MSQEKIERWDAVKGNDAPQDKLSVFLDSTTVCNSSVATHG